MLSISVGEAKNKLPFYLHLIEDKKEQIQITRHGNVVAIINGKDQFETFYKRDSFLQSVKNWREKFADCLFSNEEIDSLFSSRKDDEDYIRHPEDFV